MTDTIIAAGEIVNDCPSPLPFTELFSWWAFLLLGG